MPRTNLDKILEAADEYERAGRHRKAARMRLEKMIREADRSRIPKAEIARASGLSRPTVYEILNR